MLSALLATAGVNLFQKLISDHGENLVEKGIEKVTGIKLEGKEKLTPQEVQILRDNQENILKYDYDTLKLVFDDKANARGHSVKIQEAKDWLVRNTGSIIAIMTVACTFSLWAYMLFGTPQEGKESVLLAINSALTVSLGYVLSFYFGASKTEADRQRRI